MATIGHTLTGLSFGGLWHDTSQGRVLRYAWPGLMILMAHLVDVVEWVVILAAPGAVDRHFVTHSPLVTAGVVAGVWICIAVGTRTRLVWPYIVIGLVVFSHLLLDHRVVRTVLDDLYNGSPKSKMPDVFDTMLAEIWSYGLILVLVTLVQASRARHRPRRGRRACVVLGVLAVASAVTRWPALWVPVYTLSMLHAAILLWRRPQLRLAWSLVPLSPLVILLVFELWAAYLCNEANRLYSAEQPAAAAEVYRRALAVPARSQQLGARICLSTCQRRLGDHGGAEATLLHAVRVCERPYWAQWSLARIYSDPELRGSPLFRPAEAVRILREMAAGPCPASVKTAARKRLSRLRGMRLLE